MPGVGLPRAWALAVLIAMLAGFGGCQTVSDRFVAETDEIIIERRPGRAYEQLFPYYADLCAVSQFRPKHQALGGVPGHAVLYVKGACKDEAAPYPRLRRCRRAATKVGDLEHGAGVSVNRWFRNVNWVAVPGRELFYAGIKAARSP